MRLVRTGTWCQLTDLGDREAVARLLDRRFSYPVEGHVFAPAYRAGTWDGRARLVRRLRGGGLAYPAGLHPEVLRLLAAQGLAPEVVEDFPPAEPVGPWAWAGPELRPYQVEAVDAVVAYGGGLVLLPVRTGKTALAAELIRRLGVRALVLVSSDLLRRQTIAVLREALPGARVGAVGEGAWEADGDLCVATLQSLCPRLRTRDFRAFARRWPLVVLDEVHHLQSEGDAWRNVALALDARYKVGLSATVEVGRKRQNETGAIWLRGLCGPVVYSRTLSEMIEAGYLVRPTIRFVRHGAPPLAARRWSPAVYRDGITDCAERNARIVAEAVAYAREGRRVLVDVSRVGHARRLLSLLQRGYEGTVALLLGASPAEERARVLRAWAAGRIGIVVGTILGEGVDVPALEVVVNAEGGKARTSTIQRLRNLTVAPGKRGAVVVELVDDHQAQLRAWTLERLRIYRSEPAFCLRVEGRS